MKKVRMMCHKSVPPLEAARQANQAGSSYLSALEFATSDSRPQIHSRLFQGFPFAQNSCS